MYKIQDKQRSTSNELLVILAKFIVYIVLLYFKINKPNFYKEAPAVEHIAHIFLFLTLASLSVSVIRFVLIYFYTRKNHLKSTVKDNFILGINRIVSVFNTVFIVISLMYFMGIDPLKFLTSITIVAAAIALISKDYVTNMINGLIIMFSDRLSLGDHIKVQNEEGKILDITLLNIVLQNEDNDMVLIPNSVIITSLIVNQSKQNIKKLTIDFEMDLGFGYNPASLEEELSPSISAYTDIMMEGGFSVKTIEIKKDTARFKIQIILKIYDKQREREIRRLINIKLLELAAVKN